MQKLILPFALVVIALCSLASLRPPASPGPFSISDVDGYMRRLARANTSDAARFRQQIANGRLLLERERHAARLAGIPVSVAELNGPPVTESENAAPLFVRLRAVLERNPIAQHVDLIGEPLSAGTLYSDAEIARARGELRVHRDAIALIHEAADRPRCDFRRDWRHAVDPSFTDISQIRLASRLLQSESYMLAHDGRYRDAIAAAARGFTLASHAASEPTMLGYLAGGAIQTETLSQMRDVLSLAGGRADVARQILAAIEERRPKLSLAYAIKGETALTVCSAFSALRRLDPQDLDFTLLSSSAPRSNLVATSGRTKSSLARSRAFTPQERRFLSSLVDAAEADILRDMHRLIKAADRSWPECSALFRMSENDQTEDGSPIALFRESLYPSFRPAIATRAAVEARAGALRAAAYTMLYRARVGRYPDRLEDAMARPPMDPYSLEPLKYRREANGFVVYSVGEQGKYDGRGSANLRTRAVCCRFPAPKPARRSSPEFAAADPPRRIASGFGLAAERYSAGNMAGTAGTFAVNGSRRGAD